MIKTFAEFVVMMGLILGVAFIIDTLSTTHESLKVSKTAKWAIHYEASGSLSYRNPEYKKYEQPFKLGL